MSSFCGYAVKMIHIQNGKLTNIANQLVRCYFVTLLHTLKYGEIFKMDNTGVTLLVPNLVKYNQLYHIFSSSIFRFII